MFDGHKIQYIGSIYRPVTDPDSMKTTFKVIFLSKIQFTFNLKKRDKFQANFKL